jgi:spore maturation protein SpmA
MLNYVWLSLLMLGIGTAIYTDISDKSENKYRNDIPLSVTIKFNQKFDTDADKIYDGSIKISSKDFFEHFSQNIPNDLAINSKLNFVKKDSKLNAYFKIDKSAPKVLSEVASISGKEDDLTAKIKIKEVIDSSSVRAEMILEEVSFLKLKQVTNSVLSYAGTAVEIALGLIGIMALWLGVMKVAESAGLISILAKMLKPITKKLFPDVPSEHPAVGSMIMNISANMLGLSNAATPFGLKAMEELDKLNPNKGTATNAMCTFLAINTAGLTFIPASAIAIRAAAGSSDPAIIIGTSIFGASCATIAGLTTVKILEKFPIKGGGMLQWFKENKGILGFLLSIIIIILLIATTGLGNILSSIFSFVSPELFKGIIQVVAIIAIPFLIVAFIGYGAIKKVRVYEQFIEGAKEGFNIAVRIIPYLVAMLCAIGIFRSGGAMEGWLIPLLKYITDPLGIPAEVLPMALMRPLSGSGSLGIMAETMSVYGPDSLIGIMTSTFYGSSETTFYVLAVYFGAVNIKNIRHALAGGLAADIAGTLGAVFIVKMLFG